MNRRQKVERAARLMQDIKGIKIASEKDVINEVQRLLKYEHNGVFVADTEEDEKEYYLLGVDQHNGVRTLASHKRVKS